MTWSGPSKRIKRLFIKVYSQIYINHIHKENEFQLVDLSQFYQLNFPMTL